MIGRQDAGRKRGQADLSRLQDIRLGYAILLTEEDRLPVISPLHRVAAPASR